MDNKRKKVAEFVKSKISKWPLDGIKVYSKYINIFTNSVGECMVLVAEIDLSKCDKYDISKNVKNLNKLIGPEFNVTADYDDEYASIYLTAK